MQAMRVVPFGMKDLNIGLYSLLLGLATVLVACEAGGDAQIDEAPDTDSARAPVPARDTSSPQGDRDALAALYNATNGPNWADNTNWLTDAPLDEWYGVTTDAHGRVMGLDLDNNDLSGEIPSDLANLANLRWLNLVGNQVSGEVPSELGGLSNLHTLSLYDNNLTGEIPPQLGSLSNLQGLDLGDNDLTGEIPAELGSLSNLYTLSLHDNDLTGEIPPELGNLSNLRWLVLGGNRLTGEIAPGLGSLADLEFVGLSENQLSGCIPGAWGDVPDGDLESVGLPFCE